MDDEIDYGDASKYVNDESIEMAWAVKVAILIFWPEMVQFIQLILRIKKKLFLLNRNSYFSQFQYQIVSGSRARKCAYQLADVMQHGEPQVEQSTGADPTGLPRGFSQSRCQKREWNFHLKKNNITLFVSNLLRRQFGFFAANQHDDIMYG